MRAGTFELQYMQGLAADARFTDVTLVVGDRKFPAHKCILAFRSEYFAAYVLLSMLSLVIVR